MPKPTSEEIKAGRHKMALQLLDVLRQAIETAGSAGATATFMTKANPIITIILRPTGQGSTEEMRAWREIGYMAARLSADAIIVGLDTFAGEPGNWKEAIAAVEVGEDPAPTLLQPYERLGPTVAWQKAAPIEAPLPAALLPLDVSLRQAQKIRKGAHSSPAAIIAWAQSIGHEVLSHPESLDILTGQRN